jgi:MarR family 2-MHQ and catechol resistance regulon transcriptional repressor
MTTATKPHSYKAPAPPKDPATATALKAWVVLARAYQSVARISQDDIDRHELTGGEFAILEVLYHKGPLLLGEVQRLVLVSSGGITFLVDKLAKRGLVERQDCPSDRRARYAALTKQGEKLMKGIFPGHAEAMKKAMAGLSATEQRELTRLLKTLGKAAEVLADETEACQRAKAEFA